MRRVALIVALASVALGWPGATALAVDQSVDTQGGEVDSRFTPATVTIDVGQSVTWHNADNGDHNVQADDGSFKGGGDPINHEPAPGGWTFTHTFNTAGTFRYFCKQHGDVGGVGMAGKVIVKDPNADTTPPAISALEAKPAKFCTNKSQTCTKRGTHIAFTLSEAARVTADRRAKGSNGFVRIFTKQLPAGQRSVKFSGKGLKPGKYVLRLIATDAAGNASKPATAGFTVKKKG
jgi:plastocyanin